MTKSKLVSNAIYDQLFGEYLNQCKDELESLDPNSLNNSFVPIFKFYQNLTDDEKNGVIDYLKTIVADTTSTILGGFDGATELGELSDDFRVIYEGESIEGDLQEYFLMRFQEEEDKK